MNKNILHGRYYKGKIVGDIPNCPHCDRILERIDVCYKDEGWIWGHTEHDLLTQRETVGFKIDSQEITNIIDENKYFRCQSCGHSITPYNDTEIHDILNELVMRR